MSFQIKSSSLFPLCVLLFSCSAEKEKADLIIHNAQIYSVDSLFSVYEAMAITNGTIAELGSNEAIAEKYSSLETIDLGGKTVFPGFIDAHCHFLSYGLGLNKVNLVGTASWDEVLGRVKAAAVKGNPTIESKPADRFTTEGGDSSWIVGRGWDQNDWTSREMPDNKELDSLFPGRPVFLTRIDGHAALANSAALKAAGITGKTRISGGEFAIKNGKLSGLLIDNAIDFVKGVMPRASEGAKAEALLSAQHNCLAMGLTTVDDAGLMAEDIALIDKLHKSNKLSIRVYAMLSDSLPNYGSAYGKSPYKSARLNVRAFKYYADGALGSRGACLLKPYADKKDWKGFLLNSISHFEKNAVLLMERGFQMCTHCIGDSAYRMIVSVYKKAGAKKEQRWRIEHAQVVDPADLHASSDYIPSVQPTHATSDMYWAQERLGIGRVGHGYAYKALLKSSGTVALGTDFPVEDISPFRTFFAAVARQDGNGFPPQGYQIENALTREETLRGMTIWAAYSNFEEDEKGSLVAGKLADFIVLDKDLMRCEVKEILATQVMATYIDGERVYSKR